MEQIRIYKNADDYWAALGPELLNDEVANSLWIGLVLRWVDEKVLGWEPCGVPPSSRPMLGSVHRTNGTLDFGFWWQPPYPLNVTGGSMEGLELLDRWLRASGLEWPHVNGPVDAVQRLAALRGVPSERLMETDLFELTPGSLRFAASDVKRRTADRADETLVTQWAAAFGVETGMGGAAKSRRAVLPHLDAGRLSLAMDESGAPVSMAAITRITPKTACISYVYTPKDRRGRGHASALVARLSQDILDMGKDAAVLFTDRANPTSNKIYSALGYRPVSSFQSIRFLTP